MSFKDSLGLFGSARQMMHNKPFFAKATYLRRIKRIGDVASFHGVAYYPAGGDDFEWAALPGVEELIVVDRYDTTQQRIPVSYDMARKRAASIGKKTGKRIVVKCDYAEPLDEGYDILIDKRGLLNAVLQISDAPITPPPKVIFELMPATEYEIKHPDCSYRAKDVALEHGGIRLLLKEVPFNPSSLFGGVLTGQNTTGEFELLFKKTPSSSSLRVEIPNKNEQTELFTISARLCESHGFYHMAGCNAEFNSKIYDTGILSHPARVPVKTADVIDSSVGCIAVEAIDKLISTFTASEKFFSKRLKPYLDGLHTGGYMISASPALDTDTGFESIALKNFLTANGFQEIPIRQPTKAKIMTEVRDGSPPFQRWESLNWLSVWKKSEG